MVMVFSWGIYIIFLYISWLEKFLSNKSVEAMSTLPHSSFIVLVHLWWVALFAIVFFLTQLPFAILLDREQVISWCWDLWGPSW